MKNLTTAVFTLLLIFAFSSCAVVGGIFKAGVWVGVLIVVGILALIIFLISKMSNKN